MADCIRFVCSSCERDLEACSDGNPYHLDEAGFKHYAYHPDHGRLAKCIGNDSPHLCLGCGAQFNVDSRATSTRHEWRGNDLEVKKRTAARYCPAPMTCQTQAHRFLEEDRA